MFNHEKYRTIQSELLEFLKDKQDKHKAAEFYCKDRRLIFFKDFIFDDWKNSLVLRIINDKIEGLHIHLVELPFQAEFMKNYKSGKGEELWLTR